MASTVMARYKHGLNYQKEFLGTWTQCTDFKEGRQWPPATDRTRNLPRPVINITAFIIRHKKSNLLSEQVKFVFSPQEVQGEDLAFNPEQQTNMEMELQRASDGAAMFTSYAQVVWEDIKQDDLMDDAVDDAVTLGTGLVHYYFNNDYTKPGVITPGEIGRLEGEVIDPVNFFVGNPQLERIDGQPYILITSRLDVSEVKKIAKANKVKDYDMITGDKDTEAEGYDQAKKEMEGQEKATVITMYYKKEGAIYFVKTCGTRIIQEETRTKLTRYPVARMIWDRKKKSFFGTSEVEAQIPNQKLINFIYAMTALSIQQTAWPKIVNKHNALQQPITDIPGEIIHDKSGIPGDNIFYMRTGEVSNTSQIYVDKLMEVTRNIAGVSEVSAGEAYGKNLNASAIIALQNASKQGLAPNRRKFYQFIEDIGLIYEDFFKHYYNVDRNFISDNEDGDEQLQTFNGAQFENVPFRLKIDVGPSSSYSETLALSTLDKLFEGGHIDVLDYIDLVPQSVAPFKEQLKIRLENRQEQMMQQQQMPQGQPMPLTPQDTGMMAEQQMQGFVPPDMDAQQRYNAQVDQVSQLQE